MPRVRLCRPELGGDEFVIVAPGMPPEAVAENRERWQKIAADVASAICPAHVLSLSVGKATYPDDGGDAETLLRRRTGHSMR